MKASLTIIGSLLLFAALSSAVEKSPLKVDTEKKIVIFNSQIIDLKKHPITVKKILNKDLSEVSKIPFSDKEVSRGGATSGGGDDTGLEVQSALSLVIQALQSGTELYPKKIKEALLDKAKNVKIIITDESLPVQAEDVSQYGAAFSVFDGQESVILIQRKRWLAIDSPTIKDSLLHHELAVLAGIESTGSYPYTDLFARYRKKFWEHHQSQKFVCTFSLYRKVNEKGSVGGKLLGSAGIFIHDLGVSSNFEVIHDLTSQVDGKSNRAFIVRYVVSNNGYLRAQILEADVTRYKNSSWKIFSNSSDVSQEKNYFSPYARMSEDRGASIENWGDKFLQVACSKI